ncbi:universal stress protein [Natrinema ejinorense]|uniref:Universal stress protein UspA n=1 Tax=Natrinema ejinorense TaxID=373386 RepID=A0A2A5QQ72_9EURY|nr:universal stress protein [Natrinema ejinorense]PCR88962.1 universal stress protein UspA [Natrinema ejinorense]
MTAPATDTMFDRLLFPTDGSDGAAVALDYALDLAAEHGSTVHVLNVPDTALYSPFQMDGDVVDALEAQGERIVRDAADRAAERGVETVTEVESGDPYQEIIDYAASHDIDLTVMPTHGRRGLERFLLGSTTERVVRRADGPVLTLRPDAEIEFTYPSQRVLAPTDGSECARAALEMSVDVASTTGAALSLLTVVDVVSVGVDVRSDLKTSMLEEAADEILDEASSVAKTRGVEPTDETVVYGPSVARAIRSHIEEQDIDLVVVGTHGRTGFDRYVLGSVTEHLVRTAPVPVLTVRESTAEGS